MCPDTPSDPVDLVHSFVQFFDLLQNKLKLVKKNPRRVSKEGCPQTGSAHRKERTVARLLSYIGPVDKSVAIATG